MYDKLIDLMTGLHDEISVEDIGLDNKTEETDWLVGRASKFVGKVMVTYISGLHGMKSCLHH